jgi:hypothetical protein
MQIASVPEKTQCRQLTHGPTSRVYYEKSADSPAGSRILALFGVFEEITMTLCPIAVVTGCAKCPAFKICPLKGIIGDQAKPSVTEAPKKAARKTRK